MSVETATALPPSESTAAQTWRAFRRNPLGVAGGLVLVALALVAIAAPLLADYPSGSSDDVLVGPSAGHPLGTDDLGRDVFGQVVWGTRMSIAVGFAASVLAIIAGTAIGVAAAYFKRLDTALGVLVDLSLSLPVLPLMILIAALVGPSATTLIIVIAAFSWPEVARVVRSQAMTVMPQQFIAAANVIGGSNTWIIRKHVLPGVAPVVVVSVVMTTSRAVLSEAGLSFLGLGDPDNWSWGTILHNAQQSGSLTTAWWTTLFPSVAILLLVVSTTLLSVAYNDARNPKTR
ncbi:ABC transporter permease [Saccharothrix obliqua]|uniref:ABC transporter permease n=1 Tax=Saccharothrix obliqua TaxID=2861747 RepID=UPI001C5FF279|nr:ABC transporter permease [Saccharothrix obliqua]MBW4722483.1 ABC transporter permease [Saccharothrix obliqua]